MNATPTRKPFASERAALFMDAALNLTRDELLAAAAVLEAIANVDIEPLVHAMTCDGLGNPITITEEQRDAQATWSAANERQDRAWGWARELRAEAERRDTP